MSAIWIEFAHFYEEYGDDIEDVRTIFAKATQATFKNADDLATVWCEWAEMELRHKNYAKCRSVLKQATALRSLAKSRKLWAFMCDIEESMGTLEEAKSAYNAVMDLRVASVQ